MEQFTIFLVSNQLHLKLLWISLVAIIGPVLLAADAATTDISYTKAEKQAFLDIHNKLRSEADPTAEAMNAVVWSAKLECLAIKAAHTCIFEHSTGSEYEVLGENIYIGYKPTPDSVTKLWFDERNNYDFTKKACQSGKVCGHYTQIMTAGVLEIGCGIKRACKGDKNNNIVFCEYSHGNSFYKQGPKCSNCPKDRPCQNATGLCTGKKQDTLPDGAANCKLPSTTAADEKKGCSAVAPDGFARIAVLLQFSFVTNLAFFAELF